METLKLAQKYFLVSNDKMPGVTFLSRGDCKQLLNVDNIKTFGYRIVCG